MTDLICLSSQPWHPYAHSPWAQLMFQMSATHRVIFVEPASTNRGARQGTLRQVQGLENDVIVARPPFSCRARRSPFTILRKGIRKSINSAFLTWFRRLLEELEVARPIIFCANAPLQGLLVRGRFDERMFIHYLSPMQVDIQEEESELMGQCDMVLTDSIVQAQRLGSKCSAVNAFHQGVAPEVFPAMDMGKRRKVILVLGALDHQLDISLVRDMLNELHDWRAVVLGPCSVSNTRREFQHPRIHLAGTLPRKAMLRQFAKASVGLLPEHIDQGGSPEWSLSEGAYLSLGLPIVGMGSDDHRRPSRYSCIVESRDDFPQAVKQAMVQDDPGKRRIRTEFASAFHWSKRAQQLDSIITQAAQ